MAAFSCDNAQKDDVGAVYLVPKLLFRRKASIPLRDWYSVTQRRGHSAARRRVLGNLTRRYRLVVPKLILGMSGLLVNLCLR